MDTTRNLTSGEQSGDGLVSGREYARLWVDLETTHGVVENRGHDGDIKVVVHRPLGIGEELLAEGVLLGLSDLVVVVEGLLEDLRLDAHLLCEGLAALEALHETTADVVLAVPLDLLRRSTVEDKSDWVLQIEILTSIN